MTNHLSLAPVINHLKSHHAPVCAYYYDLDFLSGYVQKLVESVPERVRFYYAIKANSDQPILRCLSSYIYGFEVASIGEVIKCREAMPNLPIAFGGPGKTEVELEGALCENVELYHIESRLQLERLNVLARKHGCKADILLRVNPRIELPEAKLQMSGRPTQFGIDQFEIDSILASISDYEHIQCIGFHFHAISNSLDAHNHLQLVESYLDMCEVWQRTYDLNIKLINVGGGIGIDYTDKNLPFGWHTYCEGLKKLIASRSSLSCDLAMECGRLVTAECGVYLSEVTDIKNNHDQYFAVLRGGSHHFRLPSSWQHDHPFHVISIDRWTWPFKRPGITDQSVTFCGELCTPKDVLSKSVVECLQVGDVVVFEKAGAYGWHISHHDFLSHPHPERYYLQNGTLFT